MRIAYLVNQYPKTSHSFIRREIEALERMGHEIVRYTLRPTSEPLVDPRDEAERARTRAVVAAPYLSKAVTGVKEALRAPGRTCAAARLALRCGLSSDRGLAYHIAYLGEALILAAWLRDERVQHLHVHFGTNSATVAMLAGRISGIPWSFTVHGPEEFDRPFGIALAEKLRAAGFAVAISSFGRSQLLRWLDGRQWNKVKVVHCGIDKAFADGTNEPLPQAPRLLCIGRLCEQKGQLLLVEAARKLKARGVTFELVFAGDGPMRSEIEAAVRDAALGAQVRITGWLSGAEVRRELQQCRVMVLPSFAEGLPVVIMEAMAVERPVVTTAIAGIPELVIDGDTGFLVPAGDVEALAQKLETVLAMPEHALQAITARARRRVMDRHDADTEAAKLAALFRGTPE